jgi:hypothetical protein
MRRRTSLHARIPSRIDRIPSEIFAILSRTQAITIVFKGTSCRIRQILCELSQISFRISEIPDGRARSPHRIAADLNRISSIPLILSEIQSNICQDLDIIASKSAICGLIPVTILRRNEIKRGSLLRNNEILFGPVAGGIRLIQRSHKDVEPRWWTVGAALRGRPWFELSAW